MSKDLYVNVRGPRGETYKMVSRKLDMPLQEWVQIVLDAAAGYEEPVHQNPTPEVIALIEGGIVQRFREIREQRYGFSAWPDEGNGSPKP